jgi:hypothetical protein
MENWDIIKMRTADKNSREVQLFNAETLLMNWREDVAKGYCRYDQTEEARLKAKIESLKIKPKT